MKWAGDYLPHRVVSSTPGFGNGQDRVWHTVTALSMSIKVNNFLISLSTSSLTHGQFTNVLVSIYLEVFKVSFTGF